MTKRSTPSRNIIALSIATIFTMANAQAAFVTQEDQAQMLEKAQKSKYVRVMVSLDNTVTLDQMRDNLVAVKAAMAKKAHVILAELGADALEAGFWANGIGQIGLYVNQQGLKTLQESNNAISFGPDITQHDRVLASDLDSSLAAVEKVIDQHGFARVEIIMNDDGEYDIESSGKSVFRPDSARHKKVLDKLNQIRGKKYAKGFSEVESPAANSNGSVAPKFKVTIDRNTFYALQEDTDVRAIRLVGHTDPRPAHWPDEVLGKAKSDGVVAVTIKLRGGDTYSPKTGHMSDGAVKAQENAHQRALNAILNDAGITIPANATELYSVGAISLNLPHAALQRLYSIKDPRILSVSLNKPFASFQLERSTVQINMPQAWAKGYQARGQTIALIDSGVSSPHSFLNNADGTRKVVFEACFGTNDANYKSPCPNQNSQGDSPPGLLDSGREVSSKYYGYQHGTFVAGVIAGRQLPPPSGTAGRQGVAPMAKLWSINVNSFPRDDANYIPPLMLGDLVIFDQDIYGALGEILKRTIPNDSGYLNAITVNMSLGGGSFASSCQASDPTMAELIANLSSRGVPVVAATGNSSSRNTIAMPACLPSVIKVAALNPDATFWLRSNVANPANYAGGFFLAPGANVVSSIPGGGYEEHSGTSIAAPHVAGLYAAIKAAIPGIWVGDATAWISANASIPTTIATDSGNITIKRIRLPNF